MPGHLLPRHPICRQRSLKRILNLLCLGLLAPMLVGAQDAPRKKLVLLISAQSYETDQTLPKFATRFLVDDFRVVIVTGAMTHPMQQFDHIEEVVDADLLLVSVWR